MIAQGKTLIGVDPNDKDFNRPNLTGGKKTHSHKIKMRMPFDYGGVVGETFKKNGDYGLYDYEKQMYNSEVKQESNITLKPNSNHTTGVGPDRVTRTESTTGSTSIDSNLPPYFTCYIWNRIA